MRKELCVCKNTAVSAVTSFLPLDFASQTITIRKGWGESETYTKLEMSSGWLMLEKFFARKRKKHTPQCIKIGSVDIGSHGGLLYVLTLFLRQYFRRNILPPLFHLRYMVNPKVAYKRRKKKICTHKVNARCNTITTRPTATAAVIAARRV